MKSDFLDRPVFIKKLLSMTSNHRIVATTGFTSRELLQIRNDTKNYKSKDFYMVGGMGHASMVALGYSLNSRKKTICLDGDGSFLMHLGSSVIGAKFSNKNFKYILLNNGSHESVGGQKTAIDIIKTENYSKAIGYRNYYLLKNQSQASNIIKFFLKSKGPSFLEVKISEGTIKNLIRIKDLKTVKKEF